MLQCPYEQAHLIRPERMQIHLIKCERQHKNVKLLKCMFNYSHHIKPEDYAEHLRLCDDRRLIETSLYLLEGEVARGIGKPSSTTGATTGVMDPQTKQAVWGEENWDDMNEAPYDPEKHCLENKIIRKARLLTKAEKREFYKAESQRHDELAKRTAQ
ncbi:AGAP013152-PA-like protein [Anopheles sinensis]|uniref:AGAP013152-PA-like protein n=1 Tax=Anopheles sinensis TaxID=74873 RepID=A0A084VTZ4_ANOSI|nr:AGAP013152-PA-like protein [Anopheles sinensis]